MSGRAKQAISTYRRDLRFRGTVMLYVNLAVNCAYAVFEAVCAVLLRSMWMGNLAFYYIVLSLIRFRILKGHRQDDRGLKWKTSRACGVVMLVLTLALLGIHFLTVYRGHTIVYPGYIIYAVATYTTYAVVCAVRNVIVYRRLDDPVIFTSKALNLAAAVISIYSLQSALITAFGDSETFRVTMGNCVVVGASVLIAVISAVLIVRANRALRTRR